MRWQGSDWTDAIHTLICIYRCNVGLVGAFLHRGQLLLLMSLGESRSLLSKLVQITLSQVQIGPNWSKSVQIGPNRSNSLSVNLYQQHHRIFPFLVQPFPHAMQHKITVLLTHTPVSIFAFVDLLELFSTRNGICIEWNSILCQLILH